MSSSTMVYPVIASPPAIVTDGLTKGFGKHVALQPTTLSVPAGSVFALVGHNGAGKTTLIKMLLNILHPSAGSAMVLGQPSGALTGQSFERIAYVSENQELPLWMTVRQFLEYLAPFYPTWDDEDLVRQFDLPLDRKMKHLSRGMLMKAALAGSLAYRPAVLLMDEPFSGLDPLVRDELIDALLDRAADPEHPITILISSHDLGEIESFATHVAFLDHGTLRFSEEMTTLTARFREVTAALGPNHVEAAKPALPASWIAVERTTTALRFVHTQADTEDIAAQVAIAFPQASDLQTMPMGLRAIFLALAKAGRIGAEDGVVKSTAKNSRRRG